MALEFGGWAPVCGSWLRTRDAKRNPTASAVVRLARTLERLGYDFYYVPEHYLNAIHGPSESVLDAWVVSAASVVATRRIRVITAVQPGFKAPGVVAKMGATLAGIRAGAFGLSLIAGWWRLEVENYDDVWLPHAERYARASEFLDVIRGFWSEERWSYQGKYYRVPGGRLEPKPLPPPPIFIAGESEAAIELAARAGDYLFINGGDLERVSQLARRAKALADERYGRRLRVAASAFGLVRDTDAEAQALVQEIHGRADLPLINYFREQMDGAVVAHNRSSVAETVEANLGLQSGLVGSADSVLERLHALEQAGVDALMVKFEPALEAERFARDVLEPYRAARRVNRAAQRSSALPSAVSSGR